MTVDAMIRAGLLETVAADVGGASSALEEARRHAASAEKIATDDPHGAFQLAYDAARKAVMSHMRAAGVRPRRGEGGHAITARYAGEALDADLGRRLDALRRRRTRSEYGSAYFEDSDVVDALTVANGLIARVE